MELKECFMQAIKEVFLWSKIQTEYRGEAEKSSLSSTEQVNILIGFSKGLKGNVVFGFSKKSALRIASLINENEIKTMNDEAKRQLGDISRFIVDLAISKSQMTNAISLSPPIVITGDNIFLMISRIKTIQLVFKLSDALMSITYYAEQGSTKYIPYFNTLRIGASILDIEQA